MQTRPVPRQQHAADLRRRRRRPRSPAQDVVIDDRVVGWPARSLTDIPAGRLLRAGADQPLRDVPPRRRPHDQDADGPGRGAALGPEAGQLLQQAGQDARRSRRGRRDQDLDGPGDSADRAAEGHGAGEVPARPERSADEVLGPADASRRDRDAAARTGRCIRTRTIRCSSTTGISRASAESDGWRETPPDASATRQRSATTQAAAYQFYKDWNGAELPAHDSRPHSASDAVLRRLVRRELREQRPVRRRDHARSAADDREAVPRHRQPAGRAS